MTKPQELEKGDRVLMLKPEPGENDPPKGTQGTFRKINDCNHPLIRWDNWADGHGSGNREWWMRRNQLRKLPKRG